MKYWVEKKILGLLQPGTDAMVKHKIKRHRLRKKPLVKVKMIWSWHYKQGCSTSNFIYNCNVIFVRWRYLLPNLKWLLGCHTNFYSLDLQVECIQTGKTTKYEIWIPWRDWCVWWMSHELLTSVWHFIWGIWTVWFTITEPALWDTG